MDKPSLKYHAVTISGKIAVGTSTLAQNLKQILNWKYINAGDIQRQYDREHGINENKQGAFSRPDIHEKEIDEMTKKMLSREKDIIYEAWLSGFMARDISGVFKILIVCSDDAIRIDRVMNRDGISLDEAKHFIRQREEENIAKWKKLYGFPKSPSPALSVREKLPFSGVCRKSWFGRLFPPASISAIMQGLIDFFWKKQKNKTTKSPKK
ncbi:MAG: hypothetical protein UU21_C0021G0006 [Candidatus Levybacteria bacterium GW2011_GWA2_40_8]|nr:MAG: hypothetical protein UU21_C0021G0006 [Candidatus Levybacteria bacterium GW2011_GWA2_40_8]